METVVITGGTGMIGTALSSLLESKGYKIIILSRKKHASRGNVSYAGWDVNKSFIDANAVCSADHIVHLAGAGIADKRWTEKRKKEIVDSRVNSSKLIVRTLTENQNNVKTVVSASGIGWYGPDVKGKKAFVESDPPASDFLGNVCVAWEQGISPVEAMGKRLVILRTAPVLATQGGAFKEFVNPMNFGIAPILSSGKQVMSWIHIDDICRLYLAAIEMKNLSGVYNAAAPETITNKELILRTARARKRPFIPIHVPEFVLKIMVGELRVEVLKSTTVDDSKIRSAGYNFIFPTVDAALNDLVRVS
jgi:uncharacterized protein (TIGR01777 family)